MLKRRHFLSLLATGFFALGTSVHAAPYAFEEGVHYIKLPPQAHSLVSKGTVQEFFFYGCSHCQAMEAPLKEWLANKPNHIQFEAVPAVFQSAAWSTLARLHYALKVTKQLHLHDQVFDIFLVDKARPSSEQEVAKLIAAKDKQFDQDAFLKAFQSEQINNDIKRAAKLSEQYRLEAVPAFVINGKYVTDLPMAGSHAKLFSLIEELSKK